MENIEQSFQAEKRSRERFGVTPAILKKAGHLRDTVFPQAGVTLYLEKQHAYAVTDQQDLVSLGPLQLLTEMSDNQVLQTIRHALKSHTHQKRSLHELRVRAGLYSQKALADYINERFATEHKPSVISARTIWRAENGSPIAQTTALLIVAALQERGVQATIDRIDWVIGHQGKREQPPMESASSS
ncbi:hypothetical protein KSF_074950 [Reticulibacter mediterranei]|uniref:Uncharacterized protein n=1 Tax=Reticulibacter mediterranei TaxID=2778369 RepID=A0A8J3N3V2_9CHLR|nr:hypothetical protein [Reticulibacter mediterranei]GHO97447.1 hypothetical protein KSF_074950 [Reticulibacter mediterranei]